MPAKTITAKAKKTSFTISYRVDGEVLSQLQQGAARSKMSVHDYARWRLMESLERQGEARMVEESNETRRAVESLRGDIAATLEVILHNTTKAEAEKIRSWVDKNLRHRDSA